MEENPTECFLIIIDLTDFEITVLKTNPYHKISYTFLEDTDFSSFSLL